MPSTDKQRLTRIDLSNTLYLKICDAVGVNPLALAGLPESRSAIERVVRASIAAERHGAPMPGGMAHEINFEREFRLILKRVFSELRRCDLEIERLSKLRSDLSELVK